MYPSPRIRVLFCSNSPILNLKISHRLLSTTEHKSLLAILPSVQRALSSSDDLTSSLKQISKDISKSISNTSNKKSTSSITTDDNTSLPEILLPKLVAACTQGRGQGIVGQEFLRIALSPLCTAIPKMTDFSPLAAVAEAYTHVGDRVANTNTSDDTNNNTSLVKRGVSESSKLLLLRNVAEKTLELLSTLDSQLTVQQSDKLVRILASLSRTTLFKPELYERSLPFILSFLNRMPRGPQALHTLSRTAGAFIRYSPTLEQLSTPLSKRLSLELDYSRFELLSLIKKGEERVSSSSSSSSGSSGLLGGKGGDLTIADEVRRRLQPTIGSLWYIALATRFGTDTTSPIESTNSTTSISSEMSVLIKGFDFINFAYESWERQVDIINNRNDKISRTVQLNASDIGRLSALQLGAKIIKSSLFFSKSLQISINDWRNMKRNTKNVKTSKLQTDVRSALVSFCGTTRLPAPSLEYQTEDGLIVDFAWLLDTKEIHHSIEKENTIQIMPKGVVIEVDGPAHFVLAADDDENNNTKDGTSNTKKTLNILDAPSRYKFWLLESCGWQVIHIPYTEWPRKEGLIEKTRYIAERLGESPLSKYL
jgi:hypothetical protein